MDPSFFIDFNSIICYCWSNLTNNGTPFFTVLIFLSLANERTTQTFWIVLVLEVIGIVLTFR